MTIMIRDVPTPGAFATPPATGAPRAYANDTFTNKGRQAFAVVAAAMLSLWALPLSAQVVIDVARPGVAVENGADLLIALPIENSGDRTAFDVKLFDIDLRSGHLTFPLRLPLELGVIAAGETLVAQLRFKVPGLNPSRTYELTVDGRYRDGDERRRDGNRDRHDRDRDDVFHLVTSIEIPPQAGGSANADSNTLTTRRTAGPYPALPQPPQTESNEGRPPTPESTPQLLFPLTLSTSKVQDPGITVFPGIATGSAAVGFIVNTQSNGIVNRFPPDPSAAGAGGLSNVVLATGNLYVKYSTDGGKTFTTISNLSTVFGDQPDGGYCCDQVVHYVPSIDRIVWLIQTLQVKDASGNVTGHNSLRVAWARPADISTNFYTAWTWCDVGSDFLGLGNDWLDFPDISTANGHLYISVDDVAKGGLVVARISYADMQLPPGNTVTWEFTDPTKATLAVGSHLTQNARATLYWAGHNGTGQLRVFSWGDTSSQYSTGKDIGNSTYANAASDYTSKAPDGQYWLDLGTPGRLKGDIVVGAVFKPFDGLVPPGAPAPPNQIWFAWTAGRDKNFPQPYVRMLMVEDQGLTAIGEFETWNADYVFAYPALAANASTSEVAISLMWGGGQNYMNHAVGFPADFLLYITTNSDVTFTLDPSSPGVTNCDDASGGVVIGRCTRSGDFLSLRRVGTADGLFGTLGYEINLVDSSKSTDCLKNPGCVQNVRWVEFGRPEDVLPPAPPPR
jgi:hypothetical protein